MTQEVYESGNRRAMIEGHQVRFLRVTGNVRRSVEGVWFMECPDIKKAHRLAKRWVFKALLGDAVLNQPVG